MLNWLRKDPVKKLQKAYEKKLFDAMNAQRSGDIKLYSSLSQEADEIYQEIQHITNKS